MEKEPTPYKLEPVERLSVQEPIVAYGAKSRLYTYADYLSWPDDKRRELIRGLIYEMFGAPTRWHAEISVKILMWISTFISRRKRKCKVYHAPFDVRLPNRKGEKANDKIYSVVQPDICVVCDLSKLDDAGCIGAPDLIVEVQSPSTAFKDANDKLSLYEESGVREYWIVFKEGVTVYTLQSDGRYDIGKTYELEGKVPVGIFEGLEIDLHKLFNE
ncbi:MAG: Uma2 family endonuclease [Tannerellaceae bacterium]|jgi:Uma2 family endonuclease|nr:Uma2 family endonuclease [Tannerellaceae bacterium]